MRGSDGRTRTTDQANSGPLFTPSQPARRWRVAMADGNSCTVEALGFRVEGGALVFVLPAGLAAAYAPGTWGDG